MWESLHSMGNHHHRVTKMPYQEVEEVVEEEAVAAAFALLINIAHFTPFSNVRREATWSREECTEMYKSIVFLGFARNCQGQGRQLPVAGSSHTWGPPFRPAPPQNRKLPYHPWKPFIIIVIAHIIIAKKEVSLIAVQLLQNKRKDFEQKWSGIQIKEKPARYFVTLRWENKVWKSS